MMATIPAGDVDAAQPDKAQFGRRTFVNRRVETKLDPAQVARQSRAVTSALRTFASPAAAMVFLNTAHPNLGKPLDLAVASDTGLATVETILADLHGLTV